MFRAISLCLLGALLLGAADAPQKSAFDKPTLEAYVRHLYLLQPQLTVTIGDPKPSALPGFKEVRVRIAQGPQSQEVSLYVSNDGKKIVQGTFYDIAANPFKPDLDKLKTQFQPALGTAGAPVAIVLFSDMQCPYCKGEAEMIRKNLIQNYPDAGAAVLQGLSLGKPASVGQGRRHGRPLRLPAKAGGVLGLSRLGLRASGRDHRRQSEGPGAGVGQGQQGCGRAETGRLHGQQVHAGRGGEGSGRGPGAGRLAERPPCSSTAAAFRRPSNGRT